MRRFFSLLAVNLAVAGSAVAQPESQSMAQCAGLFEAVQKVVPEHENIAKIEAAAVAFSEAARLEARAEAQEDPDAWVAMHQDRMRADWGAHGGLKVFSQDFVDQVDICRGFADDHGIDIDFD